MFLIFIHLCACSGGDEPKIMQTKPTTDNTNNDLWDISGVEDLTGVWLGLVDITADIEEYLGYPLQEPVLGEYYVTVNDLGEVRDYIYVGNIPLVTMNCYVVVEKIFALVHVEDNVFLIDGYEGKFSIERTDTEMIIFANGIYFEWTKADITPEQLEAQLCDNFPSMTLKPNIMQPHNI